MFLLSSHRASCPKSSASPRSCPGVTAILRSPGKSLLYLAVARIIALTSSGASRLSSRMFPALSMNLSLVGPRRPSSPTVLSALKVAPLGLISVVVGGGSARSAPGPVGRPAVSETPTPPGPPSAVGPVETPAFLYRRLALSISVFSVDATR